MEPQNDLGAKTSPATNPSNPSTPIAAITNPAMTMPSSKPFIQTGWGKFTIGGIAFGAILAGIAAFTEIPNNLMDWIKNWNEISKADTQQTGRSDGRRLSDKQRAIMLPKLKAFGEEVRVSYSRSDPEASQYAADLIGLFWSAGFQVIDDSARVVVASDLSTGLGIFIHTNSPPCADSIREAIRDGSVDARFFASALETNVIVVYVARKP